MCMFLFITDINSTYKSFQLYLRKTAEQQAAADTHKTFDFNKLRLPHLELLVKTWLFPTAGYYYNKVYAWQKDRLFVYKIVSLQSPQSDPTQHGSKKYLVSIFLRHT